MSINLTLLDQVRGFLTHMGLKPAPLTTFGAPSGSGAKTAARRALYRDVVRQSAESPEAWAALPVEERLKRRLAAEAAHNLQTSSAAADPVRAAIEDRGFEVLITDHGSWPSLEQARTARQQHPDGAAEQGIGAGERFAVLIIPLDRAMGQSKKEKSWILAGDPGVMYKTSPGPDTELLLKLGVWQLKAETLAARKRQKEGWERAKEERLKAREAKKMEKATAHGNGRVRGSAHDVEIPTKKKGGGTWK